MAGVGSKVDLEAGVGAKVDFKQSLAKYICDYIYTVYGVGSTEIYHMVCEAIYFTRNALFELYNFQVECVEDAKRMKRANPQPTPAPVSDSKIAKQVVVPVPVPVPASVPVPVSVPTSVPVPVSVPASVPVPVSVPTSVPVPAATIDEEDKKQRVKHLLELFDDAKRLRGYVNPSCSDETIEDYINAAKEFVRCYDADVEVQRVFITEKSKLAFNYLKKALFLLRIECVQDVKFFRDSMTHYGLIGFGESIVDPADIFRNSNKETASSISEPIRAEIAILESKYRDATDARSEPNTFRDLAIQAADAYDNASSEVRKAYDSKHHVIHWSNGEKEDYDKMHDLKLIIRGIMHVLHCKANGVYIEEYKGIGGVLAGIN